VTSGESVQQYAKMTWLKRFNNVTQTTYLGSLEGNRVFAVGVMGSVTIKTEDIPHCVAQLRDMADALEKYHRDHPPRPLPPQPVRARPRTGGPRCQQASTRNATSRHAYGTCNTPLDGNGQCANASTHVGW